MGYGIAVGPTVVFERPQLGPRGLYCDPPLGGTDIGSQDGSSGYAPTSLRREAPRCPRQLSRTGSRPRAPGLRARQAVGTPTAAASCRTSPADPGLLVTAARFCRNANRRLHRAGLADPLPVPGRSFLSTARTVDLRAAGRAARRPRLELQPLGADWTRAHRTDCHELPSC